MTSPTASDASAATDAVGALSPSRASDFMTCPLRYRFRVVDRLPESPTPQTVRGTLVHGVLERLFDAPAAERTPQRAADLVQPQWESVLEAEPGATEIFDGDEVDLDTWLDSCRALLRTYFDLEDPRRIEPAERETYVEHLLDSRLLLRGYVDRLDVAPTGEVRVVDYKTGRAPGEAFEAAALFQMKFYALVLWRARGVVPTLLQLVYLGNGEVLRYSPDEEDLRATERKVEALWRAIDRATRTGEFRPRKSALCRWCDHQAICPEWGGTPPPMPSAEAADVGHGAEGG